MTSDQIEALCNWLETDTKISSNSIDRVKRAASSNGSGVERLIIANSWAEEPALLQFLAKLLGVEFIATFEELSADQNLLSAFGPEFFSKHGSLPMRNAAGALHLVSSIPTAKASLDELSFLLQQPFVLMVCTGPNIRRALQSAVGDAGAKSNEPEPEVEIGSQPEADLSDTAIKTDAIIYDAIDLGASDIHFESTAHGLRVRLRIDGVLSLYNLPFDLEAKVVVSRLKLLGGMSVTDRRHPQDGRATIERKTGQIELRLSSVPNRYGESLVCRILDPNTLKLEWADLGFDQEAITGIQQMISAPSGLFIVSGPTGSGKTTTLYAALKYLNTGRKKIITVEDPVEYSLDGVEQIQVNAEIGLSFAAVLRAMLRQDPDIVMIGEIRDEETAEIACRAALIGRLVLATLHASSAEGVPKRLMDLGVERFMIDDVLLGVLAQRLVPVVCGACVGKGCADCRGTGAKGRKMAHELVAK